MFEPSDQGDRIVGWRRRRSADDAPMNAEEDWRALQEAEMQERDHPLDAPDIQARHSILMGHYTREMDRQEDWRLEMELDEDFYDGIQWSPEEIEALTRRGQAPLVFNVLKTTIDWILGTQRSAPTDYKVLPRRKEGLAHAERKSSYMKYISDVWHSQRHYSRAFEDAVKVGVGWIECGWQAAEDGEPVYERAESWRNVLWDSTAMELDLSDARYLFRTKWVDLDDAIAYFPDRAEALELSSTEIMDAAATFGLDGDEVMDRREEDWWSVGGRGMRTISNRRRVRLIEGWFTVPEQVDVIRGGDFSGEIFDRHSMGHVVSTSPGGLGSIRRTVRQRMKVAIMTPTHMLSLSESPYRHNKFPLTPVWGHRRARDGAPYGIVRQARDPQRDLNKRAASMLWHSVARRVIVQDGSVDDIDELREEAGRPDAVIAYKQGFNEPRIENDLDVAAAQGDIMSRDAQFIQEVSGVTDENLGRRTNATSGTAIVARQEQGQLASSGVFANYRDARRAHGEKLLAVIEQFVDEPRVFRVTDGRGMPSFVNLNEEPDDPSNDGSIWATKADFVISEDDWRASLRQAQVEALFKVLDSLAKTAPDLVAATLDLFVEAMDFPHRDEIVRRIRRITGQMEPDADPNNLDPETQAALQERAAQAEMQRRMAEAQLQEQEAKAAKVAAAAAKERASVAGVQTDVLERAIAAAIAVIQNPGVGAVADAIRDEATASAAALDPQAQAAAADEMAAMQQMQQAEEMP